MMHDYDKLYLDRAQNTLARMLDFAVYDLKYDISHFHELFIASGIADSFEKGVASIVVGRSGVELAYDVLELTEGCVNYVSPRYTMNRSEEYWTGWALAYYQCESSISFSEIEQYIPIKDVKMLYSPYHEMDIRQFSEKMSRMYHDAKKDTNLKILRNKVGLTQKELAAMTDIPFRTIQQYEQKQKDINKAQSEYIMRLAKALNCGMENLIER